MPHLVVSLSSHGYGHAAQLGPIANELYRRINDLWITIRTGLNPDYLATHVTVPFAYREETTDFGMLMASALDVLVPESTQRYAALHGHWSTAVRAEARRLEALAPDLVLSNVSYLTLAGAAVAQIPAVGMSSLTWRDIFAHYGHDQPGASTILADMEAAYRSARRFIQLTPTLPMSWLDNRYRVGPVARLGRRRREAILDRLGLAAHTRLVLVSLGGIATRLPMERWPAQPGTAWLVPESWDVARADCFRVDALDMPFCDILASSDLLITKPGYGSYVEAACNGTAVLYVRRGDWPEEPYFNAWISAHARARQVTREQLERGELAEAMAELLSRPAPPPVAPTGIAEAAAAITDLIRRGDG